ncbi:hypothetical protein BJV78DRAFT_1337614 [Lactifluus subvellereus]|nr:hypothetical protein BJV78DRAFT_1337614 [Lactifluus subvellereus]
MNGTSGLAECPTTRRVARPAPIFINVGESIRFAIEPKDIDGDFQVAWTQDPLARYGPSSGFKTFEIPVRLSGTCSLVTTTGRG